MTNDMDDIFRALEEDIRAAGANDQAVPDILRKMVPELSETIREGIKRDARSYHTLMEAACDLADEDCASEEEMQTNLAVVRTIVRIARYYKERLRRAVGRDRDVPWETRVAMDLMISAFGEQLGA